MKEMWVDSYIVKKADTESYNYTPSIAAKSAFFYLKSVGHFFCDFNFYVRRKNHKSFLLIYTVAGKGYAKYRGKEYKLKKGQAILFDCYDYQEYRSDGTELWKIKWLHFNGSSSGDYFNLIYNNMGPVVNMYEGTLIPECLDEILKIMEEGDLKLEIKVSGLIVRMLTEILLSASARPNGDESSLRDDRIRAALEYIDLNYTKGTTLKEMAAAACVSVYHFTRLFKNATGYSPYEYLVKYRINKAKGLLKTTEVTVDEIAGKVGFESASNFTRTFRELEDMTPVRYRRYWSG